MQLKTNVTPSIPASTRHVCSAHCVLTASGNPLKVELGDDELNVSCPPGKVWAVTVDIQIVVSDA